MLKTRVLPILTVVAAIVAVWYVAAVFMNAPVQRDMDKRAGETSTTWELVQKTMSQAKPTLPYHPRPACCLKAG